MMEPWPDAKCTNCTERFTNEGFHLLRIGSVGHVWCIKCMEAWKKHNGITEELRPGTSYPVVNPPGRLVRVLIL